MAEKSVQPALPAIVCEFLEEWLRAVKLKLRTSTWEGYRSNIRTHITPSIGHVDLRDVTPQMLMKLYSELADSGHSRRQGGLSHRSIRYVHAILHRAFDDAVRWGYLDRSPAAAAQPPRSVTTTMKTWNAEQTRQFLAAIRGDQLEAAWVLAVTTGMRRGEILGLRWNDVDIETNRLQIRQTLLSVHNRLVLSEPKTKRGFRQFTLPRATAEAIAAHRERGAVTDAAVMAWAGDLMFVDGEGHPIHPDGFTRRFRQLGLRAGLPPIRLHDLRHTFATLALPAGVHVKVVSEILGHSNINITLETYSHVLPELQTDALERVASVLEAE